ncbi:F-box/kelch-repeat protein At3g06240-like [Lycium ferocissimum]|uniref:F-box/kelch-repeat protein At3g06240-like n=1 Tax=Lycium ferocissimum TaxID=112874 RepID=UPI002816233E|nr:F-box/kelch-repeat protein At3g06240-like [Lycium ferocissimum]
MEIVSLKESRIEILSLKENNWRVIGSFLHAPRGRGVYLNGKLHWTASHTPRTCQNPPHFAIRPPVVVVVDLGTENIQFLQAPPSTELPSKVFLKVLGGNLCAIVFHPEGKITETWVMKEYGVEASWEKRMTLKATHDALYGCKTPLMVPLAYSENKDDILVDDCGERFIWSIKTEGQLRRDARIIKTPDETENVFPITGCEVYMGSLVTPRREEGLAFEGVQIEAAEDLTH